MALSTKPEVHRRIATPSGKDRAMATDNMHKEFGEVRPCGFGVMRADRKTGVLITILRNPIGAT